MWYVVLHLTLFLPALGRISPYKSIMWQQLVGRGFVHGMSYRPTDLLKGFWKFLNFKHDYNFPSEYTVQSNFSSPCSNILIFVGFLLLELKSHRNEKSKTTFFPETVLILLLFTRPYRNFTLKCTDVRNFQKLIITLNNNKNLLLFHC